MRVILFLFSFVFFSCTFKSEVQNPSNNFLWKLSKDDQYIWIMGSIHMADSSFYPLALPIQNAFNESQVIAFEIDLNEEQSVENPTSYFFQNEEDLESFLPPKTYQILDSILSSWALSIQTYSKLRPWAVAAQISALAISRAGFQAELGIDYVLMEKALEEGKEIIGLETSASQIEALSSPSDSAGVLYLEKTLLEIQEIEETLQEIKIAWQTGSTLKLLKLLNLEDSQEKADLFSQKIYFERNRTMAHKIQNLFLENKRHFVVVGIAHLIGEEGSILEILKENGFRVEAF